MSVQPSLVTERLRLRPFTRFDAPTVWRLAGERAIAATTINIPHPYEEGMAERWIAEHAGAWRRSAGMICAIERKDDARLVGAIGLRIEQEQRRGELGYWIGRPWWGQGYATEAARALVGHGFGALGLERIYARTFRGNPASGRVLSKIGMQQEGLLRRHIIKWGHFEDIVMYGILAEEFTP